MPLDASGQYRHNHESAMFHSQAKGKSYTPKAVNSTQDDGNEGEHTKLFDHHDGTFHTVHPEHGQADHESIGHMHAHLSKIHGEEGHSHFHAHHDGMTHHSHSARSGEEPEHGEHDDVDGVHDHLAEAMGDGAEEPDGDEAEMAGKGKGKGLNGLY